MSTRPIAHARTVGSRWFTITPADRPDFVWRLTVTEHVAASAAMSALVADLAQVPHVRRVHVESSTVLLLDGFVARSILVAWCSEWWDQRGCTQAQAQAQAQARVPLQRVTSPTSRRRGALRLWSTGKGSTRVR